MTQAQIDHAVAGATGELVTTVHHLGFSIVADAPGDLEPEDLRLVVACPSCRRPVPYPGRAGDGSPVLAECAPCDVLFDFAIGDVHAIALAP